MHFELLLWQLLWNIDRPLSCMAWRDVARQGMQVAPGVPASS